MSSVGIGKTFSGVFVGSVVLMVAFVVVHDGRVHAPRYDAQGTFRTIDLLVDRTTIMGSNLAAGEVVLSMRTTSGNAPLEFRADPDGANTWDFNIATGSDTAPANILVFNNTPTNGSNDGSLRFKIVPGTGAVGGIELRPNGTSYFDPGSQTNHDAVLAIGFEGAQYMLDVRDFHTGSYVHPTSDCVFDGEAFSCRLVNAVGDNPFATAAGSDVENIMVHGEALAARDSGTAILRNIGGDFSAANGTDNVALRTRAGRVQIDGGGGAPITIGSSDANTVALRGLTSIKTGTSSLSADPSSLSIESASSNFINFLTPTAFRAGINFDNALNTGDGYIQYGTVARSMIIGVANATKLTITSGLAAFDVNVQTNQDWNGMRIGHDTPSVDHGTLSTGSTDWVGDVTGIGANTSVVLTYAAIGIYTRSRCQVTPIAQSVAIEQILPLAGGASVTFSCFSIASGLAANCDDFTYSCVGQQ